MQTISSKIILPKQFNKDLLQFKEVKTLPNNGKSVYMNYNKGLLIMQTPMLRSPFGIQNYNNDGKYTIQLSFDDKDTRPDVGEFFDAMKHIDSKIMDEAALTTNSVAWFKKKAVSMDWLTEAYKPIIHFPKGKDGEITDKYAPTFRVKFPFRDGKFECAVYNHKREPIENSNLEELLQRGCQVQMLIQCMGLWIAGSGFGCHWKVIQMKLGTMPEKICGYAFTDRDDDDEEEDKVQDSDDDEKATA